MRQYFYQCSCILSGSCLVSMLLVILAQITARFFDTIIPSSEDFAGWLLSATIFFGLAYTFENSGHIRMTVIVNRLSAKKRRLVEIFSFFFGLSISGFMAYYMLVTVYESFVYHEVSDTYLPVPLWIVQTPMAVGSTFLAIAMLDSCIQILGGKNPQSIAHQELSGGPG